VASTVVPREHRLDDLVHRLTEIRQALADSEGSLQGKLKDIDPSYLKSARNLAHYLALRHRDIRPLQQELAELGLSSLGRAEAHVMATLDAVLAAIHGIANRAWRDAPRSLEFREGNKLLRQHTEALLGPAPAHRAVRIMVTMPSEPHPITSSCGSWSLAGWIACESIAHMTDLSNGSRWPSISSVPAAT